MVVLVHDTKIQRAMGRSMESFVCILEQQQEEISILFKIAWGISFAHGKNKNMNASVTAALLTHAYFWVLQTILLEASLTFRTKTCPFNMIH